MNTSSSLPLSGRIALVTGAGSGMGAAIAAHLATLGASVAALGRREDRLTALATAAADSEAAGRILAVPADITSDAEVEAAVARIHRDLGPVDILVNSAGVMLPNPLADGRADEWGRMIDTNLTGLLRVTRAVLPDLTEGADRGPRDIVNISSIAAHVTFPDYAV
ncbi:MAG: short-chain dehydrogenase, partial [Microbacterium sp. 14-71-5]